MRPQFAIAAVALAAAMLTSTAAQAGQKVWISLGDAALSQLKTVAAVSEVTASVKPFSPEQGVSAGESVHLIEVDEDLLPSLSGAIHESLNRCGGFAFHPSKEAGLKALKDVSQAPVHSFAVTVPKYTITQQAVVNPMLSQVQASNIAQTITSLASNVNRYYTTAGGLAASNWLLQHWTNIGKGRSDFSVELFNHPSWKQKSVIATIQGSDPKLAAEIVVLGGHLDSINQSNTSETGVAPGADDDASGVASVTEVMRVMIASNYKPLRTIKFIGYSAEEVGLRGSAEIAANFAAASKNVVGVLQLDMTNYQGSTEDVVLIQDYTTAAQNTFLQKILSTYLPTVKVGTDKCGYACSDHSSWTAKGYAGSFPFEARMSQHSPYIHSANDTLAKSNNQADQAMKFSRMALAYAVELASEGAVAGGTPVADFSYAAKGLSVTFSDKSTDTGGTIGTYAWNFGDNSTSNTANPTHAYAKDGTYSVSLTVTDAASKKTSTKTQSVTVSAAAGGPVANFTYSALAKPAHTMKFVDTSTTTGGATISTRAWDFGDGKKAKTPKPNHTYAKAGTYTVSETVTDSNGKSATKSQSVVVK